MIADQHGAILVTGASGFVGRSLVAELRRREAHVIEFGRTQGDIARFELQPNDDIRHVFHLAAKTFVPDSWKAPREFYEVNVMGTINVLEFCRKRQARLTLMSSYVYGRPERLPIGEDHPVRAFNPYANSKILAENAAEFYHDAFGVSVTSIRPFNIYGPEQAEHFLIPTLVKQACDPACDAVIVADDRPKRDYLFIDDLIQLLMLQLDNPAVNGAFNAGSGSSISVRDVAAMIIGIAGANKPVVSRGLERPDEVLDTVADITKAQRQLGWTPRISIEAGLRRVIASVRQS